MIVLAIALARLAALVAAKRLGVRLDDIEVSEAAPGAVVFLVLVLSITHTSTSEDRPRGRPIPAQAVSYRELSTRMSDFLIEIDNVSGYALTGVRLDCRVRRERRDPARQHADLAPDPDGETEQGLPGLRSRGRPGQGARIEDLQAPVRRHPGGACAPDLVSGTPLPAPAPGSPRRAETRVRLSDVGKRPGAA